MTTTIATLRHGETDFNVQKRYAGHTDVPLNEHGLRDAEAVGVAMPAMAFDALVVSPLLRAVQTARCLPAARDLELVRQSLCMERNYGRLQELREDEIAPFERELHYVHAGDDYHSVNPPDGETLSELRQRAEAFRDWLFANYEGRRVLIVSHGVFLQQFHAVLRGEDWFDALKTSVKSLELNTFTFCDGVLVAQSQHQLGSSSQSSW